MVTIVGTPNGSGSETGAINFAGDVDNFNVFLRGGELYRLQANSTSGLDPTLRLRSTGGTSLAFDDDSGVGLNSQILHRQSFSVNRRLDVAGFGASTGSYRVVASEVPGNTGTYSTLNVNGSNTGDLHANGDRDFHRINLVAGRTYRFNLNGANHGSGALADPFLELRNSANAIVRSDDDSGVGLNSQLTFTAPTSGTYFANARAFANAGSGGYRLSATQIA